MSMFGILARVFKNKIDLIILYFRKRELLSNFAVNGLSITLLRVITLIGRILILLGIAKISNPSIFGLIALAFSVSEIGKIVADFGVDTATTREYAILEDRDKIIKLFEISFTTKIITSSLVFSLLLAYFTLIFSKSYSIEYLFCEFIVASLVVTTVMNNSFVSYLQAKLHVKEMLAPLLLVNIVTVPVAIALMFSGVKMVVYISLLPISELVTFILLKNVFCNQLNYALGFSNFFDRGNFNIDGCIRLIRSSFPIALTSIIVNIYTRLDVFVLSIFFTKEVVGNYSIAARLTEPLGLLVIGFNMSFYSFISKVIANQGRTSANKFFDKFLSIVVFSIALASIIAMLLIPAIIQKFFDSYSDAIPLVYIMLVSLIFRVSNACLTSTILACGEFKMVSKLALFNLFVVSTFSLALIPKYGAIGSAVSLLIAESINTLIQFGLVKKRLLFTTITN